MTFMVYNQYGYPLPFSTDWRRIDEKIEKDESGTFFPNFGLFDEEEWDASRDRLIAPNYAYTHRSLSNKLPPIGAGQVMTQPVVTVTADQSMESASELVIDKRFRHVPVVNSQRHVVGLVSDRSITREVLRVYKGQLLSEHPRFVVDVMVTNVLCTSPATHIGEIAQVFIERRIGAMPIVNEHGELLGIVTRSDILRTLVEVAPTKVRA